MKKLLLTITSIFMLASICYGQPSGSPFGPVPPSNTPYNATTWDGSYLAPTQNSVRDILEAIIGGSIWSLTTNYIPKQSASGLADSVFKDDGTNATIEQNSVQPFTSVAASAVDNTLYLKEGKVGIGTTGPASKLTVATSIFDDSWANGLVDLTAVDVILNLVSNDSGSVGSQLNFIQVDTSEATDFENQWSILRKTNGDGIGDGTLRINYGTNVDASLNTTIMTLNDNGNLGVGQTTFGTSAAKVLGIGNGTAPTTSPADSTAVWSANQNSVDGYARLYQRTEDGTTGPVAMVSEVTETVNTKMPSQAVHLTAASSGSTGIVVADDDDLDMGTGNFTIPYLGSIPDWTPSSAAILMQKTDGTNGWILQVSTAGLIQVVIASQATYSSTVAPTITNGTRHKIMAVITRETASTAGSVVFYVDGKQLGSSVTITAGAPTTVDNASSLYIAGTSAVRTASNTQAAYVINYAMSAAEVADLYKNGVSFADQWGSQTEQTSGTLTVGKRYRINDFIAGDDFSNIGATNEDGNEFVATGTTPTTWTNSSTVVPLGPTLALLPENIQTDKWYDAANGLDASYPAAGASLVRPMLYVDGGDDVAIADGGTGASTKTAAFDALSPMTTIGDLIYGGASGTGTRLPAGATTEILVGGGAAAPVWTTATGSGAPVRAGSPTFTTQISTPIIALTGGQVAFPATAVPSADVNTLDDYEEGTWTPALAGATTNPTLTGTTMNGYYTKIGRQVTVTFDIAFECTAAGVGGLSITGLPFTVGTPSGGGFVYFFRNIDNVTSAVTLFPSGSVMTLYQIDIAGDDFDIAVDSADLLVSAGGIIRGSATYFTD